MTASLASLRTRFRSWKKDCGFFIRWRAAALAAVRRRVAEPPRDVLIYPSDPAQIVGAIGDDAMITAVVGHFTGLDPEARFTVLCRDGAAAEIVRGAGHTPLQLPEGKNFAREMLGIFRAKPFDALVVIGADVMDGYYSAYLSKELLIAADLAARSGMRSIILGFSFNDAPPAELRKYFAGIDRAVELNLRDPISLERLRRFAPVRAIPVADSAFLISPASVDEETRRWIAAAKASGKTVLGLNLHPMLFTSDPAAALERLIAETAKALERVSGEHDAAWLLVPHDYRAPPYGDEAFLRALQAAVGERDGLMVRYFEGHHRATTLKGLAGLLDGVITGRMHLAIAALGMGTPVMCFAYQGKFAGLFRHFGLSETWLVEVGIFDRDAAFAEAVLGFFRNLAELRDTVRAQLPGVERMAALNFVRVNP